MAAAIGPAIGVGSSIIGGLQNKSAQKRQEKFAREQWNQLLPMLQSQNAASQELFGLGKGLLPQAAGNIQTTYNQASGQFEPLMQDYKSMLSNALSSQSKFNQQGEGFMDTGRNLMASSQAQLMGALSGLGDLRNAYRPFLEGGASAIEKFLPKGQALNRLLAGQFGDINQGFKSAGENIANFAPRGGGRVSSLANADVKRQQDLNAARAGGEMNFGGMALQNFFQGAQGTQGALGSQAQIAQMLGQQGLGAIGAGQQSQQLGIGEFGSKAGVGLQQLQAALQSLGLAGGQAGNLAQLASSTLGQGMGGQQNIGSTFANLYNAQANRAYGSQPPQGGGSEGLGSFLVKAFSSPDAKSWMNNNIFGGSRKDGTPGTLPGGKVPPTMGSQKTPG